LPPSKEPVATTFRARHEGANVLEEYGSSSVFKEGCTLSKRTPGYSGAGALLASVAAANGFARGQAVKAQTGWKYGQQVFWGGAFFLPTGFFAAKQVQIDIFRWDNFDQDEATTERGGLVFRSTDKKLSLVREKEPGEEKILNLGADENPVGPEIRENRWNFVIAHQVLYAVEGEALNKIWVNGQKVAESTKPNCVRTDLEVSRYRAGIVATGSTQTNPISLAVDDVYSGPKMMWSRSASVALGRRDKLVNP
jgi:hypothetical protein